MPTITSTIKKLLPLHVLVAEKLRKMKLDSVAKFVEDSIDETLSYMGFLYEHWVKIRTNNGLERIIKENRRRKRVVAVSRMAILQ